MIFAGDVELLQKYTLALLAEIRPEPFGLKGYAITTPWNAGRKHGSRR
jgi:hypothetical protein